MAPLLLRSCNWPKRGEFLSLLNRRMVLMMGKFSTLFWMLCSGGWESSDEGWKDFLNAFSGVWVESLLFVHRNATHTLAMFWISMSAANANGERLTVFSIVSMAWLFIGEIYTAMFIIANNCVTLTSDAVFAVLQFLLYASGLIDLLTTYKLFTFS